MQDGKKCGQFNNNFPQFFIAFPLLLFVLCRRFSRFPFFVRIRTHTQKSPNIANGEGKIRKEKANTCRAWSGRAREKKANKKKLTDGNTKQQIHPR
jgi:hypothetical protein